MSCGFSGLQSQVGSSFLGCGSLKQIVAVLCDSVSALQAFLLSSLTKRLRGRKKKHRELNVYKPVVEVRDSCRG